MKKRVIMTEGQLEMIQLLEGVDYNIESFQKAFDRIDVEIKRLWNEISFISIADLAGKTEVFEDYHTKLQGFDEQFSNLDNQKEVLLDKIEAEKGYESMSLVDSQIDRMGDGVRSRQTSLEYFVYGFTKSVFPQSDYDSTICDLASNVIKSFPEPREIG